MAATPNPVPETLESIGENATLERIFPRLPSAASQILGPGDDAAVIAAPDGRYVVTTDMMVHGPDFRLAWSTPHDLGWKAAASNLADVAAMGAVPTALVVAIAAPPTTAVTFLEGIADGLRDACAALAPDCGVVGGDLSVSSTLAIAVTAFGDLEGRAPVLRSGAVAGDIVAICGDLGLAAAGIRLLFDEATVGGLPDAALGELARARFALAVDAQLAPRPPIAAGKRAALAGATSMIDLSDGLAIDGRRVATASNVAFDLSSGAVGSTEALTGGEDHSLLATFPAGTPLPEGFRAIGVAQSVVQGVLHNQDSYGASPQGAHLLVDGEPFDTSSGWDPYTGWDGARG